MLSPHTSNTFAKGSILKSAKKKKRPNVPSRTRDMNVTHAMLVEVKGELRSDILRLEHKTEARFDRMEARFNDIDARFKTIDARFNEIDARFNKIDARFNKIDARFKEIDARFKEIDARFDKVDARFKEIDARFNRVDARLNEMDSKLHEIMVAVHRIQLIVEEQNTRNKIALDGYHFISARQDDFEYRYNEWKQQVEAIITAS